jgi:hypothetical protein
VHTSHPATLIFVLLRGAHIVTQQLAQNLAVAITITCSRQPTRDTSMPSPGEPRTPKSRKPKSRLNLKQDSQPTPTRNRKRYDPQRRLEVAETRRNGACARCREKKVRVRLRSSQTHMNHQLMKKCSPTQHKSSTSGSPQSSTDTLSHSSRSPRDDGSIGTITNNRDNTLGVEGCVQVAREYLKVAQSHVEKFARFVEAWESSQKQSTASRFPYNDANISEVDGHAMTGGSPQSSKSSSTIAEDIFDSGSHEYRTGELHKFLSDLGKNTYICKDQNLVSLTSMRSTDREKAMLVSKDRNRSLRPKSSLTQKATSRSPKTNAPSTAIKGWRPSLKGENRPWVASAALDTSEPPRQTRASGLPKQLDETSDQQKQSKKSNPSSSTIEEVFPEDGGIQLPSVDFLIDSNIVLNPNSNTEDRGQPFEDFQFHASKELFEMYGNAMGSGFNFGLCPEQGITHGLDDPFISSLMTSQSSLIASEPLLTEVLSEYVPTAWGSAGTPLQAPMSDRNMNFNAFEDMLIETPSNSLDIPSLSSTPWSFMSQSTAIPQNMTSTPSRKPSGQYESILGFWDQEKELEMTEQPDFWSGGISRKATR